MSTILWVPIFSMRSHGSGEYSILKDGNFQLTLSRVIDRIRSDDETNIILVVPQYSSDHDELENLLFKVFNLGDRIKVVDAMYDTNASMTRHTFWRRNHDELFRYKFDLLITDIVDTSGRIQYLAASKGLEYEYNMNISKIDKLPREYVDKFYGDDVQMVKFSKRTTVLNQAQKDQFIADGHLIANDKIEVYQKVAHPEIYSAILKNKSMSLDLGTNGIIFWPFRISDSAYRFNEFKELMKETGLSETHLILATDPNNSLGDKQEHFVRRIRPTKEEYYKILDSKPYVVMLDDVDLVLHPGTIEFLYFGCRLVCFENSIFESPWSIKSINEIPEALSRKIDKDFKYDYSKFIF